MKIIINASQVTNRSGTAVYTRELISALLAKPRAEQILVFWPEHLAIPPALPEEAFIKIPIKSYGKRLWFDHWRYTFYAKQFEAQVVHFPCSFAGWRYFKRTVVTIHDVSFLINPKWFRPERAFYYRIAIKQTIKNADLILTGSSHTAQDLINLLHLPEHRIRVTPYAARSTFLSNAADLEPIRRKYGLPERYFLCVGTFEPRKNLERCVNAFERSALSLKSDLVFVGRWGWKCSELKRQIDRSPYKHRIILPGFVADEDLPGVFQGATALIYISLYEGFGLPLLEAMACGTPVIASNSSSIPEVVGDAAFLIDPLNTEELAHKMVLLDHDAELCKRLAEMGRQRATEFNWQQTASLTLAAYRDTLHL